MSSASTIQRQDRSGTDRPTDTLEFQVEHPSHPRRRLQLRGTSYTLGSGSECSVKLDDPSVRQMHALLLRLDSRVLIRGYGIAIMVNGQGVSEELLEEGDYFDIGEYRFTLLQRGNGTPARIPNAQSTNIPESIDFSQAFTRSSMERFRGPSTAPQPTRLSFADGMRLVAQQPTATNTSAWNDVPSGPPAPEGTYRVDQQPGQHSARFPQFEETLTPPAGRAEVPRESSRTTHAVEMLTDRLDALLGEFSARESNRYRNDQSANYDQYHAQQRAFEQLTDRVKVLETAIDTATREAQEYRAKHDQALGRIEQLETQLEESVAKHTERQSLWEQEAAELKSSVSNLNDQLNKAQEQLQQHRSAQNQLNDRLHKTKQALDNSNQARQQLSDQLQKAHAEIRRGRDATGQINEQLRDANAAIQEYSKQHQESAARIERLEHELTTAIDNHRTRQQAWESEASELNASIERLSRQLAISESQSGAQREESARLQQELEASQSQLEQVGDLSQDQVQKLNEELQTAQQQLESLQSEQAEQLQQWQQEREDLEFKIANQAAELSQISALRASAVPDTDSEVADRLAERLEAQVQRLQQEQGHESLAHEIDAQYGATGESESPVDAPAEDQPEAQAFPDVGDQSLSDLSGFGQPTQQSAEDIGSTMAFDASSITAPENEFTPPEVDDRSEPTSDFTLQESPQPEPSEDASDFIEENVYQQVTSPDDSSDYSEHLHVENAQPTATEEDQESYMGFTESEDASDYESNDFESSDQSSPWQEFQEETDDSDDPYSGLAAGLISELDEESAQAESFNELTESAAFNIDDYSPGLGADGGSEEIANEIANTMLFGSDEEEQGEQIPADYYEFSDDSSVDPNDQPADEVDSAETYEEQVAYEPAEVESLPEPEPEPVYEPEIPEVEQSIPETPAPATAPSESTAGDDEESIEAYMDRLLQRMHGDSDETPQPEVTPTPTATVAPEETSAPEPVAEPEEPEEVMTESEYVPRSTAPERTSNMEAMRELANDSARHAIAKSVRGRQRNKALIKLVVSAAFIIGAGIFAVLAQTQLMPHIMASGACVLLAFYSGISGLALLKSRPKGPAQETPEPQPTEAESQQQSA